MQKLRYGCIGAGKISDIKHLSNYSKMENVELISICDPNYKAAHLLAEKYGIEQVYSDYKEMLQKENLDFVSICTPTFSHAEIAVAALRAGCDVHSEKPLAVNSAQVADIINAKNESKRIVMVGLNNRFRNEHNFVKELAKNGDFGDIYHIRCGWVRRRGIPGRGGWFTNKELSGGGCLIDLGAHFLDLAMYFLDYPDPLTVTGETYSKFENNRSLSNSNWNPTVSQSGVYNVEDMATGFIRVKQNITIDFEFSWAANIEKQLNFYEIMGTKAGARYTNDNPSELGHVEIFSQMNDTCVNIKPDLKYPVPPMNEFQHFIDCITKREDTISTPEQAYKLLRIIEGAYESTQKHCEIKL